MNGQREELERIALSATFIGGLASFGIVGTVVGPVLPAVAYTPPGDRVAHARGNSR
jgi:ABC-type xylose transport system permease subunit